MKDDNGRGDPYRHADDAFQASDMREPVNAQELGDPLYRQLVEDGARWRMQHAAAVEERERRLRARLGTYLDGSAERTPVVQPRADVVEIAAGEDEEHMDDLAHGDRSQRAGQMAGGTQTVFREPSPLARGVRRRGRRALAFGAAAAALFLAIFGTVIVMRQQQASTVTQPLHFYTWSYEAALGSTMPQDAFAAAMTLTPCEGAPASRATVTWLEAGRNYGLALIRATCTRQQPPYAVWWLFSLGRDAQRHWVPQAGAAVNTRNSGNLEGTPGQASSTASSAGQIPPWLSLPPDNYAKVMGPGPKGLQPEASLVAWRSVSLSRTFVFGHVADRAIEPVTATPVNVDGYTGWVTEQNDTASVVVPLADGTTFFCAGTAPVAQMEEVASGAFAHMNELLAPLTR